MRFAVNETNKFNRWFDKLRDRKAKQHILDRLDKIAFEGSFGQFKSLGEDWFELKISTGKGYRIYYTYTGETIILLLVGGDKQNKKQQQIDIKTARLMIEKIKDNNDEQ